MKKLILTLVIAIFSFGMYAQTTQLSQFEDEDHVTTVVITKKTFELMAKVSSDDMDQEAKEMVELIQGLNELKIYTTENSEVANEMNSTIKSYVKDSNLSELLRVNDKDAKVKIYIKEGKDDDHVTELLLFVNEINTENKGGRNPESVVISITGDIDLTKISKLINQMNVDTKNIKIKHEN
mgnify:CR=1 FL=1|tara:strand:+ start:28341 stop:28883 length:543 start_codon:yes stop_codon:yes gene_type:complete